MSWLYSILGLVCGAVTGWYLRGRRIAQTSDALSMDTTREDSSDGALHVVLDDIRVHLSQKFDRLSSLMEQLEHEEGGLDEELLSQTRQLTDDLALVYDDIRRFAGRIPEAKDQRVDEITQVGNRRALDEWLDRHLAYLARYGNEFSIALFGFEVPDAWNDERSRVSRLACLFTELLSENVRETDHIFRYSASEFVVTLPETPLAGAMVFALRMVGGAHDRCEVPVHAGITGVRHTDSSRSLMNRADAALYQAKSEVGQLVCFHDGTMTGSSIGAAQQNA